MNLHRTSNAAPWIIYYYHYCECPNNPSLIQISRRTILNVWSDDQQKETKSNQSIITKYQCIHFNGPQPTQNNCISSKGTLSASAVTQAPGPQPGLSTGTPYTCEKGYKMRHWSVTASPSQWPVCTCEKGYKMRHWSVTASPSHLSAPVARCGFSQWPVVEVVSVRLWPR